MQTLTLEEKKTLLRIARKAINSYLQNETYEKESLPEALSVPCGAFVTLKNKEKLRGCIGLISAKHALHKTVAEMAVSAAARDTRFKPVSLNEMEEIDLEISVLSPLRTISDVAAIEVGKHGLFIQRPPFQGLLLPQVATENNWDREAFLNHACLKAGLSSQSWKDKETIIQIFSAEVFDEKSMCTDSLPESTDVQQRSNGKSGKNRSTTV